MTEFDLSPHILSRTWQYNIQMPYLVKILEIFTVRYFFELQINWKYIIVHHGTLYFHFLIWLEQNN